MYLSFPIYVNKCKEFTLTETYQNKLSFIPLDGFDLFSSCLSAQILSSMKYIMHLLYKYDILRFFALYYVCNKIVHIIRPLYIQIYKSRINKNVVPDSNRSTRKSYIIRFTPTFLTSTRLICCLFKDNREI